MNNIDIEKQIIHLDKYKGEKTSGIIISDYNDIISKVLFLIDNKNYKLKISEPAYKDNKITKDFYFEEQLDKNNLIILNVKTKNEIKQFYNLVIRSYNIGLKIIIHQIFQKV